MEKPSEIYWEALEHDHIEKKSDWFWGVAIVGIAGAILAIYFNNLLFALVILLSAFSATLHGHKKPEILEYIINRKGVRISDIRFPYSSLDSFWVIDNEDNEQDRIIIKSKKIFMPYIVMPFNSDQIDPDLIRDYLLDYLDEEELEEPLSQKIMEIFGF